jgi:hypothetical protein
MLLEFSTVLLVVAASLASACRIAAAKYSYSSTVLQVHVVTLLVLLSKTGTSTTSTVLILVVQNLYSESTEPKIRLILKMYLYNTILEYKKYMLFVQGQNTEYSKEVLECSGRVESSQSSASAQLFDRTTSIESSQSESPKDLAGAVTNTNDPRETDTIPLEAKTFI